MKLIDAEKLITSLQGVTVKEKGQRKACVLEFIEILKNQPMAFDVDWVVDQLEFYLAVREEMEVVYIPKFVIEDIINAGRQHD